VNDIDDPTRSCTVLTESLGDWSSATMLAEYEVNRNTAVRNNTNTATRTDDADRFVACPANDR